MQEMLHCYDSTEFLALKSFKSGVRKKKKKSPTTNRNKNKNRKTGETQAVFCMTYW